MTTVVDRNRDAAPQPASLDAEEIERSSGAMFHAALAAVEMVNVALGCGSTCTTR